MIKRITEPIPDVRQLRPELPEHIRFVISRAMAKNPQERYQSVMEIVEALENGSPGLKTRPKEPEIKTVPIKIQQRVLDVAMAEEVLVGRAADLVAMIRQTESRGLIAVLELDDTYSADEEDIISRPFKLEFPIDDQGQFKPSELLITLIAPDFDPPKDTRQILVPPEGDSEPVVFLFTPLKAGILRLTVELYKQETNIASRLLRTNERMSAEEILSDAKGLVSIPLQVTSQWPDRQYQKQLFDILVQNFNLEEIQQLCFELGLVYEDLPGDTISAKARGLILALLQLNRLPELVELIGKKRPSLTLPIESTEMDATSTAVRIRTL